MAAQQSKFGVAEAVVDLMALRRRQAYVRLPRGVNGISDNVATRVSTTFVSAAEAGRRC